MLTVPGRAIVGCRSVNGAHRAKHRIPRVGSLGSVATGKANVDERDCGRAGTRGRGGRHTGYQ